MSMIDIDKIKSLATLYKTDKINTKINGEFILNSFLYCALQIITMRFSPIETMTQNNRYISSSLKSKEPA